MTIKVCPNCGAKNRVNEIVAAAHKPICGKCGATLKAGPSGELPQTVTDTSFAADVLEASSVVPVLVDAWAEWCGPCKMLAPVIDQLAAEAQGRYKITKLNVDDNPKMAAQFNLRSIPTLLIFKNGNLVDQLIGAQAKSAIAAKLAAHV